VRINPVYPGLGRRQVQGRREKGEGRREKGEGRREKGEGRREKGEGRREKGLIRISYGFRSLFFAASGARRTPRRVEGKKLRHARGISPSP
jgi:hypothetical protein